MPTTQNDATQLVAALYVRLSREDRNKNNKEDDSESIVNQQTMLLDYCQKNNIDVFDIYNDEDFSGSDRDRPEFNRMIADARNRKFSLILCKTQSRFARDMELVEKYINGLFSIWGIRFIGLVDNADSANKSNRKQRQIISMVDQWYLEDLSENIKATLSSKRKQGLWVGAFTPYGYIKNPENKNQLIIDDEAAEIVRYVFKLYLQGYGIARIARKLNEQGIPNPSAYKRQHNQPVPAMHGNCSNLWHTYSIQRMLSNQVYIGNTVQGVQENISYKTHKKRYKPKEEWDIVEKTHEPIIERDVWNKAQKIRGSKIRSTKTGSPNVLAGKVKCQCCGGSMRVAYNNHLRYFRCHTCYIAPTECKGMTVSEKVLHNAIIKQVNYLFDKYIDEERVDSSINIAKGYQQQLDDVDKKIASTTSNITKISDRLKQMYIDKIDGVIAPEEFKTLKESFSKDREGYEQTLETLKEERQAICESIDGAQSQIDFIREHKHIEELDAVVVNTLIDKVEVGGNKYNRVIDIHWNL